MASTVDNPFESLISFGQISQGASTAAGGVAEGSTLESNVSEIKEGLQIFFGNEYFRRSHPFAAPLTVSNVGGSLFPGLGLIFNGFYVRWICVRVYIVPSTATDLMVVGDGDPILLMPLNEVGMRKYEINCTTSNSGNMEVFMVDALQTRIMDDQQGLFVSIVGDQPISF